MPRRCPACGRTWGADAAFCGACGAALAPTEPTSRRDRAPTPRRGRWLAAAGIVAVLAVVVMAVPRGRLPGGGTDVGDDAVDLPSASARPPSPAPRPTSGPPICTQEGATVDCVRWQATTSGRGPGLGALPGAPVVLVSTEGTTEARDTRTGRVRWTVPAEDSPVFPLRSTEQVLVVADREGSVHGLDTRTGQVRWDRTGEPAGSRSIPPPEVVVLTVPTPGDDGAPSPQLEAIDPLTGRTQWTWAPPWPGGVTAVAELGDEAVFAMGGGQLARVDATTGTTAWTVPAPTTGVVRTHAPDVVSVQELVDASGGAGMVTFRDAATGAELQQVRAGGLFGLVVVDGVAVVHLPADHVVQGLDLDSGRVRWRLRLEDEGRLATTVTAGVPAVVVHERRGGRVRRLDPVTGDVLWETQLPPTPFGAGASAFLGQPLVADDRVVVEDHGSVVSVLDLASGTIRLVVDGGPALDVRSIAPLIVLRHDRLWTLDVPAPERVPQ